MTIPVTALAILRGISIALLSLWALLELWLIIPWQRLENRRHVRAAWLHRWCRVALYLLGARVDCRGTIPRSGLLVSNHLSYLDIIVYSSIQPCLFVAKSEVERWPLFGWLARAAGSIFVNRNRRSDAEAAVGSIR